MADPRLQWRQLATAQPNVAGLMRGANEAFNNSVSAADRILGDYDKGQREAGDQELARLLASTNDREALNALVNSEEVRGLRLSENGIQMLNEAQGNRVDWNNTDSIVRDRDGRLGIAQAAEGRTAAEYADGVARRQWKRDNAGLFIEGEENAFTRGLAPASLVRTESGGNFAAQNDSQGAGGKGHFGRVQFGRARFAEAQAAGAVPPGMSIEQFGQDTPEGRAAQKAAEEWHFGDIQNQISQRGLEKYIGQTIGGVEITRDGIVAMAHLGGMGGAAQYLQSGGQYNPADDNGTSLSDYARTHAGNTSGPSTGGFEPYAVDRGGSAYARAMAESGLFTGQESLTSIDPLRQAATAGQAEIDRQRDAYTADVVTGITQQVVSSDEFRAGDTAGAQRQIQAALEAQGDYSTAEAAGLAANAVQQIENDAALKDEFTRGATTEVQAAIIEEALQNSMADAGRELRGQDQYRALNDIGRYSEDPTANLERDLGIPDDPQTRGDYDSENLRRHVNSLADKFGVEPAVVAVAMRDAFKRDPGDDGPWWTVDFDLTRNTIANRFDEAKIKETVDQLTPERRREFDRAKSELTVTEARLKQNATQQRNLTSRLNRMDEDNPRREELQEQLDDLVRQAAEYSRKRDNLDGRS